MNLTRQLHHNSEEEKMEARLRKDESEILIEHNVVKLVTSPRIEQLLGYHRLPIFRYVLFYGILMDCDMNLCNVQPL